MLQPRDFFGFLKFAKNPEIFFCKIKFCEKNRKKNSRKIFKKNAAAQIFIEKN